MGIGDAAEILEREQMILFDAFAGRVGDYIAGRFSNGSGCAMVEDEPLVALDIVATLEGAGAEVGSAGTAKEALHIIDTTSLDAALLDANLRGHPVDEIAAALVARNVHFLFVTGCGRESLPRAFAKTAVLSKPFSQEQLIAAVTLLVEAPATVRPLRK
jgi:CheY-like chemotaxis protein